MPRITRLSKQKRQNRVNVYLDGKFAFGLPLETVVKQKLKVGRELSPDEIGRLIKINLDDKLFSLALRFLSFRPRTEKEVRRYLKQKGVGEDEVAAIVNKLVSYQLLDDAAFVSWWLDQRAAFRPKGKRALLAELLQKGISREQAEKALATFDESAAASAVARKYLKKLKDLNDFELRQKITAALARRGFSWETIKEALDEITEKV